MPIATIENNVPFQQTNMLDSLYKGQTQRLDVNQREEEARNAPIDRERLMRRQDAFDKNTEFETILKKQKVVVDVLGSIPEGDAPAFDRAKQYLVQTLDIDPGDVTVADLPRLRAQSGQANEAFKLKYQQHRDEMFDKRLGLDQSRLEETQRANLAREGIAAQKAEEAAKPRKLTPYQTRVLGDVGASKNLLTPLITAAEEGGHGSQSYIPGFPVGGKARVQFLRSKENKTPEELKLLNFWNIYDTWANAARRAMSGLNVTKSELENFENATPSANDTDDVIKQQLALQKQMIEDYTERYLSSIEAQGQNIEAARALLGVNEAPSLSTPGAPPPNPSGLNTVPPDEAPDWAR